MAYSLLTKLYYTCSKLIWSTDQAYPLDLKKWMAQVKVRYCKSAQQIYVTFYKKNCTKSPTFFFPIRGVYVYIDLAYPKARPSPHKHWLLIVSCARSSYHTVLYYFLMSVGPDGTFIHGQPRSCSVLPHHPSPWATHRPPPVQCHPKPPSKPTHLAQLQRTHAPRTLDHILKTIPL
jgi:hypothetical protein